MPPRTIDNLGVDVSTRYAEDQKKYDEKIIKEARGIPLQAEIDVTIPSFSSEVEELLGARERNIFWADFYAPPKYNEQKKRLFRHQIIPSLGSEDKKETQAKRIIDLVDRDKEQKARDKDKKKPSQLWADQKELESEEREKAILLSLLNRLSLLDKYLVDINSRRSQYQKG